MSSNKGWKDILREMLMSENPRKTFEDNATAVTAMAVCLGINRDSFIRACGMSFDQMDEAVRDVLRSNQAEVVSTGVTKQLGIEETDGEDGVKLIHTLELTEQEMRQLELEIEEYEATIDTNTTAETGTKKERLLN